MNAAVEIALPKPADYTSADHARLVVNERMQGPFPAGVDEGDRLRFRLSVYHAGLVTYRVESSNVDLNGLAGEFTAVLPNSAATAVPSKRHSRWWSDDPDPAQAVGPWLGARWVSAYRQQFLGDFAERLGWCRP